MKTTNEALENVFSNLSAEDVERVNEFIRGLGVNATVLDPLVRFHFQLAVAAVIEEIRALEVGTRTLSFNERCRYEALLKL